MNIIFYYNRLKNSGLCLWPEGRVSKVGISKVGTHTVIGVKKA
ncbi:hypothetical protein [Sulfurovum sp.]|nr:hypothetical protein [Sulfurovum sp.]